MVVSILQFFAAAEVGVTCSDQNPQAFSLISGKNPAALGFDRFAQGRQISIHGPSVRTAHRRVMGLSPNPS